MTFKPITAEMLRLFIPITYTQWKQCDNTHVYAQNCNLNTFLSVAHKLCVMFELLSTIFALVSQLVGMCIEMST